jgi:hypothetical protein
MTVDAPERLCFRQKTHLLRRGEWVILCTRGCAEGHGGGQPHPPCRDCDRGIHRLAASPRDPGGETLAGMSSWTQIEAERAFSATARARRRASVARRLRGRGSDCGRLAVHDERALRSARAASGLGLREIPLDAISGTVEPNRAAQFDRDFRPAAPARARWQSVWMAEQSGALLPPISVVPVGDGYAIRDGHHRVSVARARGAATIDAIVGS